VVVHAPSNAGLKGSELVRDRLRALDASGLVEYRELEGVAAAEMPRHYGDADIVLDQFSLGIYGVAACEALAAGRVVISHVSGFTRSVVLERTGHELPIVESTAASIEATLREVLADREGYAARAALGPAFVAAVHDGATSAEILGGFLGVSTESPQGSAWENGRMPKTRPSSGERS
jgi:glycosyltransferase involved in cell wall biosynthesis